MAFDFKDSLLSGLSSINNSYSVQPYPSPELLSQHMENQRTFFNTIRDGSSYAGGHANPTREADPAHESDPGSAFDYYSGSDDVMSDLEYLYAPLAKHYGLSSEVAYQEALANTSHQREIEDLQRAGLNPVLSANYRGADSVSVSSSGSGGVGGSGGSKTSAKGIVYYITELATGSAHKAEAAQGIADVISTYLS